MSFGGVAAFLVVVLGAVSWAQDGSEHGREDGRKRVLEEIEARLEEQWERTSRGETLRQSWAYPDDFRPMESTIEVRIDLGIEIVTESDVREGRLVRRDYFLDESRVYALRVQERVPRLDGTTRRDSENWIFFGGNGPLFRSVSVADVPLSEKEIDLSEAERREVPLPPGLEKWSAQLTARAFDLARTFRSGVGQHSFRDWDTGLLEKAPPAGSGVPAPRTPDWLPDAGVHVLPVIGSASPDGLFAIGWGYDSSPVDWRRLAHVEEVGSGWGAVTFSTKLAEGPLDEALENDANFLLNLVTGETAGDLGLIHGGDRPRFNHDGLLVSWSPGGTCFVTWETGKWWTESETVGWIENGICERTLLLHEPLVEVAVDALEKAGHPASSRLREDRESFLFTLTGILIEDDGSFEAVLLGQIPRDEEPGGLFQVRIEGQLEPGGGGDAATVRDPTVEIVPFE